MFKINWEKGDFAIRTMDNNGKPYVELVKWTEHDGRRSCFTLAYFHKDMDGYVSLCFVGERPFTELAEIDINEVWKELFMTQLMLQGKEE